MEYTLREKDSSRYLSKLEFDKTFTGIVETCYLKEYEKVMTSPHKEMVKIILDYLGDRWEIVPIEETKSYQVMEEKK